MDETSCPHDQPSRLAVEKAGPPPEAIQSFSIQDSRSRTMASSRSDEAIRHTPASVRRSSCVHVSPHNRECSGSSPPAGPRPTRESFQGATAEQPPISPPESAASTPEPVAGPPRTCWAAAWGCGREARSRERQAAAVRCSSGQPDHGPRWPQPGISDRRLNVRILKLRAPPNPRRHLEATPPPIRLRGLHGLGLGRDGLWERHSVQAAGWPAGARLGHPSGGHRQESAARCSGVLADSVLASARE
jgi:hypothetical protein